MKKGYRLCIKMQFGGYGLIKGFETLEDAILECKKSGAVITNKNYVILDENNNVVDIEKLI